MINTLIILNLTSNHKIKFKSKLNMDHFLDTPEVVNHDRYNQNQMTTYESFLDTLGRFTGMTYFATCMCCFTNPYQTVSQGEKGAVLKFGKLDHLVNPGLHYINRYTEQLIKVDCRLVVLDLSRQTVITHDNLTINIDCMLTYKIIDIPKAKFEIIDIETTLVQFTYATLKDVIGSKTLQECLTDRENIANHIGEIVRIPANNYGVQIESMRFKDIHLSESTQHSLSAAAFAQRSAEAKMISARADVESAKMMREAADILSSGSAMQIRELETLKDIARNSTKAIFIPYNMGNIMKNLSVNMASIEQ
jgi:regulator of protease activity HflC (stomatin/prohibitin superfamily)